MHAFGFLSQIIECQNETQRLLCEKKWWPKASEDVEQSLKAAVALLRRRIRWSLTQRSQFEKHLEVLKNYLKSAEEIESNVRLILYCRLRHGLSFNLLFLVHSMPC